MSKNHKVFRERFVSSQAQTILSAFVCFGLVSSIALPPLSVYGLGVYIVTFVSPLLALLVFMFWSKAPVFHFSALFPMLLGLMVCVSALFSWFMGFSSINTRDLVESIKYFQFFPYLLAIPFLGLKSVDIFHRGLFLSAVVVGCIGFFQVLGIGEFISRIYLGADSAHLDSLISGRRITLTGSDPNVGGVIAAFFCVYFFSMYAVSRKFLYVFFSIIFVFLCFLTQSRTALVALVFALSTYFLFFFRAFILYKFVFLVFGFFFLLSMIYFLDLSYLYLGFQYALEGRNNSLNVRLDNMVDAYYRFLQSPVVGLGPAKSSFSTIIDSEYALIIQRYGLLGVFLFFCYFVYLLKLAYSLVCNAWGGSLLIFTLISFMVMMTNNIFSGYQLMSLVVLLNVACILSLQVREAEAKEANL